MREVGLSGIKSGKMEDKEVAGCRESSGVGILATETFSETTRTSRRLGCSGLHRNWDCECQGTLRLS